MAKRHRAPRAASLLSKAKLQITDINKCALFSVRLYNVYRFEEEEDVRCGGASKADTRGAMHGANNNERKGGLLYTVKGRSFQHEHMTSE